MDSAVASSRPPRVYTEHFTPEGPQVSAARRFVMDRLGAGHPRRHDAALLTSEIFTNSCDHTDTLSRGIQLRVIVVVYDNAEMVRVSCVDAGAETTPCVRRGGRYGERGRGLTIVNEVAEEWGFTRMDDGETETWFVLR